MVLVTRAEVLVSLGLKESDFTADSVPSLIDIDNMITSIETYLEEKFGTITPAIVTDHIMHLESTGDIFFLDKNYVNSLSKLEKNVGTDFEPSWEEILPTDFFITDNINSTVKVSSFITAGYNKIRYTGTFGIGELQIFKDIAKAKITLDINESVFKNMSYKGGNKEFKIGSITLKKNVVAMADSIKEGRALYNNLLSEVSGNGKIELL